jgi:hypothetical protein
MYFRLSTSKLSTSDLLTSKMSPSKVLTSNMSPFQNVSLQRVKL